MPQPAALAPLRYRLVKLLILLAGVAAVVAALASTQSAAPRLERRVLEGLRQMGGQYMDEELPVLSLTTLSGEPFNLDSLRGRVVFLNLWASWCAPCEQEVPSMIQLATRMASEAGQQPGRIKPGDNPDFVMVAVSWDEDPDQLRAFLTKYPDMARTMVVARDPGGTQTRILGTQLLPETYIIDQSGRMIARFQNAREWNGTETLRLLQSLIRRKR
jgi:cytochrome c biogenesis protein CcmG, thiol:disulfide interchange protein DsbE